MKKLKPLWVVVVIVAATVISLSVVRRVRNERLARTVFAESNLKSGGYLIGVGGTGTTSSSCICSWGAAASGRTNWPESATASPSMTTLSISSTQPCKPAALKRRTRRSK